MAIKINEEDRVEHARLIGGEVVPRKRRNDPACKPCYQCFYIMANATRVCWNCGHEFYPSKAKKNETVKASDVPINFGELR